MREYVSIEKCCDILDSLRVPVTASERTAGIYPYYGANGVQDYVDDYIFDDELVLVAEDGGNFGSKTKPIAYRVSGKCWVNNHAHVLKPHDDINVDYLCYSLMFYNTESIVQGATRKKLNQAQLRKMKIPYLPLSKQLLVVKEISTLFDSIRIKNNQIDELNNLVKSRFIEMFSNINEHKTLNELTIKITDGSHNPPKGIEKSNYLMLSSQNIQDSLVLNDVRYLSKEDFEKENKRTDIQNNDVLLTIVGTIGRTYVVKNDEKYVFQRSVAVLKPKKEELNGTFLSIFLQTPEAIHQLEKGGHGTSQKGIYLGDLKKIITPCPSIDKQKQFEKYVQEIDKSKLIVQKQIDDLQELLGSKMDEYFG